MRRPGPADLRLTVSIVRRGSDAFPQVTTLLMNVSPDELIVPVGPSSVTVHAGQFVQGGKSGAFAPRRQVLRPNEFISLDPPAGAWSETSSDGTPELMFPLQMPAGNYDLWATFRIDPRSDQTIESDHSRYEAH